MEDKKYYKWELVPLYEPGSVEDLKAQLKADTAKDNFPIGTEIPDTYAGHSNPLIVAQYLDSSNNTKYGGVEGVILVRKYAEAVGTKWGSDANYGQAPILNFLQTTYLNNTSEELKSLLSPISVQYNDTITGSTTTYTLSDQLWFLMSDYEVLGYVTQQRTGINWDYWKQKTGLSGDGNSAARVSRIQKDVNGNDRSVWLRSKYALKQNSYINLYGDIVVGNTIYNNTSLGVLPACFISKN